MTIKLVPPPAAPDFYSTIDSTYADLEQYLDLLFEACCDLPGNTTAGKIASAMQMAMYDRVKLAQQDLDKHRYADKGMAS